MSSYPPTKDGRNSGMKKIIIGVCAMHRKAHSKPMKAIMAKMCDYYKEWLDFTIFPEEVILNEPVENWPLCDCLISFHSTDFPLRKAIEYERLRRPYVLNDLNRQFDLLDRRKVFRTLALAGIDHPRHCVLVRDEEGRVIGGELKEHNDHIEVNGMIFNKPFVEKPISAEDHNVYIYYPSSVGGGSQRLFRKVNDRSSWYSPVSTVRHVGSYIYEEFIPADGTDVKVYAVGPYYAHAEARKAPGLDGKVERDCDGKEVRYPVILSSREKMIARRVVLAFGQTVCGFDLLRDKGRSFVCDVNGFSFVKTSKKYYEDTAKILGNTILRRLASSLSIPWHIPFQDDDPPLVSTPSGKIMELRCVLAVIRHGDRTPKQKMKVIVDDERFFKLFKKYDGMRKKEIKMKRPTQLMEVLELIREILAEQQTLREEYMTKSAELMHGRENPDFKQLERDLEKCEESVKTWDQMRTVLEMYGHFSGINRKVQLKYLKPKEPKENKNLDLNQSSATTSTNVQSATEDTQTAAKALSKQKPALMLILKWGGELTTAGVLQAEALGKLFRTLYPGIRRTDGKECPEDTQGLGFLRLHSTYRHDLKIYSSDEGRVQMTAAAFAKGLLALEGELTPILMQMVKSANTDGLLNDDYSARQFQNELKSYLHSVLQVERDFTPEDYQSLNPSGLRSLTNAMEFIKNPRKMCHEIAGYVQRMCEIIRWHKMQISLSERNRFYDRNKTLYLSETWELAERRWSKELREFRKVTKDKLGNTTVDFDISKIPDIYDNIKYDMEHNPDLCINNEGEFERFYLCVKNMADIVVPQEYGISEESKICVAQRVCSPLMSKIRNDLHRCVQNPDEEDESLTRLDPRASEGIATPMRHVRTRLYFTSESHIHTLMNLIRYGGLCTPDDKKWQRAMNFLSGVTEFNYMTQVVLMVYEDSREDAKTKDVTERFHIELMFSPGLYPCFQTEKERIYESRFNSNNKKPHQGSSQNSNNSTSKQSKKSKNLSGKSSSDANSDKESVTEVEGSDSGLATNLESRSSTMDGNVGKIGLHVRKSSQDSSILYMKSNNPSSSSTNTKIDGYTDTKNEQEDKNRPRVDVNVPSNDDDDEGKESDDELTEHSVNLVVLGELTGKQFTSGDLARHSPPSLSPLRRRHPTYERSPPTHKASTLSAMTCKSRDPSSDRLSDNDNKSIKAGEFVKIVYRQNSNSGAAIEATGPSGTTSAEESADQSSGKQPAQNKPHHYTHKGGPHHQASTAVGKVSSTNTIVKSMSDNACNRRRAQTAEAAVIYHEPVVVESTPMDNLELDAVDANQATVGHGRGELAKQLANEIAKKDNKEKCEGGASKGWESEGGGKSKDKPQGPKPVYSGRTSLADMFNPPNIEETKIQPGPGSNQAVTEWGNPQDGVAGAIFEHRDSDQGITFDITKREVETEEEKPMDKPKESTQLGVPDDENRLASSSTIKDEEGPTSFSRRSRFPYRFKHHTVNLLSKGSDVENRLISTNVLMGRFADADRKKAANSNPMVLATAVIGRSTSAPRLQCFKAEDEILVSEIRRFWPPLRSLETMHDNISFKDLDHFLERMMKNSTPLPSPPKTPIQREDNQSSLDSRLKDTIQRLARMGS